MIIAPFLVKRSVYTPENSDTTYKTCKIYTLGTSVSSDNEKGSSLLILPANYETFLDIVPYLGKEVDVNTTIKMKKMQGRDVPTVHVTGIS